MDSWRGWLPLNHWNTKDSLTFSKDSVNLSDILKVMFNTEPCAKEPGNIKQLNNIDLIMFSQ